MDINSVFTRQLLSNVRADVRKAYPSIKRLVDCESAVKTGRQTWFVEIVVPGEERLHLDCRAWDSYEAKAKGWAKFLERPRVDKPEEKPKDLHILKKHLKEFFG